VSLGLKQPLFFEENSPVSIEAKWSQKAIDLIEIGSIAGRERKIGKNGQLIPQRNQHFALIASSIFDMNSFVSCVIPSFSAESDLARRWIASRPSAIRLNGNDLFLLRPDI
jgi:hypothetical protein